MCIRDSRAVEEARAQDVKGYRFATLPWLDAGYERAASSQYW